jgi:hypothetical protein
MAKRRLSVRLSPGFSADLWSWSVVCTEAPSGKVEIVWQTSSSGERRERERTLPEWCAEVWRLVDAIDFACLPPNQPWTSGFDDADVLTLERQVGESVASSSLFYAPKLWPALPEATRAALLHLFSTLDLRARTVAAVTLR